MEAPQHGYWRRLINQLFSSLMVRQSDPHSDWKKHLMEVVMDMRDSIRTMQRRKAKKSNRDR